MSDSISRLRGFAPRGRRGIIGLVIVAVLAFVLGGILRGGERGRIVDEHAGHDAVEPTAWTCSMHPQIKLPKAGKCPICYMDLIPLESGAGDDLGPRQIRMSETAKQLARIQTTPAVRAFAEAEVRMAGKITYDETRVAYITAWVPGRLDRLYANYTGVVVARGDHLADMYSPELLAAQEELIQANAAVAALDKTKSAVLRSTAQATVDAARDKLRLHGLSADQIDAVESTHETSDHLTIHAPIGGVVVHKDAKEGMYVETGTRIYTIADLSKLWVMLEAYESDLPWLKYGQSVEFTSTSFPGERFEAIISFIDPLVDPKTRTVRVRAIVENTGGRLKPDMFISGVVKSRIDGDGNIIDASLAGKWISPMHPEIVKDRPGSCDVCGMDLVPASSLGYVGVTAEDAQAPLLIPVTAPLITGKRAVVYVEIPNESGPLFEGREIELGPRAGDFYVVRSGIAEGEMVVSNGAFKIDSELQIQAKPSMMSPEGGVSHAGHDHGGMPPPQEDQAAPVRLEESGPVRTALAPVYNAYFGVQMALANDNLDAARASAKTVSTAAEQVDMSLFSEQGHGHWMVSSKRLSETAANIVKVGDIEAARDAFFHLSKAAIELHERFGHGGAEPYYLTFCPMARQGDGAYWLQTEDVVWNSYYGATMLRCGSIEETLAPGGK